MTHSGQDLERIAQKLCEEQVGSLLDDGVAAFHGPMARDWALKGEESASINSIIRSAPSSHRRSPTTHQTSHEHDAPTLQAMLPLLQTRQHHAPAQVTSQKHPSRRHVCHRVALQRGQDQWHYLPNRRHPMPAHTRATGVPHLPPLAPLPCKPTSPARPAGRPSAGVRFGSCCSCGCRSLLVDLSNCSAIQWPGML